MAQKGFFSWFKRKNTAQEEVTKVEVTAPAQTTDVPLEAQDQSTVETKAQVVETPAESTRESSPQTSSLEEQPQIQEVSEEALEKEFKVATTEVLADESVKDNLDNQAQAFAVEVQKNEVSEDAPKSQEPEPKLEEPRERPGFFKKLMNGLKRTRENIGFGVIGVFKGRKIDDDLFEDLETALLTADVGFDTTSKLMNKLTKEAKLRELHDADSLTERLTHELHDILKQVSTPLVLDTSKKPYVILMVGVNGVGKTTTIGKMASLFKKQGLKVMLAAGDTFRAAAVDQLKVWGQRTGIPVVSQATGADSASVIYDAFNSAKAKGYDVLIADTAGRLQNKANLMEELRKIVRVMQKIDPSAPHEVMLTLDAGTGQNAISQAKLFSEVVPVTGVNITKLDGTAKGGVIFNIADNFGIPIRFIGIGEGVDDLREFNADDFINALFNEEASGTRK
ncbi:MAG: signal recognition particle-docking protein FtsY [Succinivibrionaceae bacterium]|nr:signal recognition particle-docking protein FtsY [Succinivibrionaceae bacterium]